MRLVIKFDRPHRRNGNLRLEKIFGIRKSLKMMAADNDDAYNLTPAFTLETVAAAAQFIQTNPGVTLPPDENGIRQAVPIAAFLAWPTGRVKHALAQHAIEEGHLSKKTVESLRRLTLGPRLLDRSETLV